MSDIILTVPWTCQFEDGCSKGWHLANYWWDHGTGEHTVDRYSDGDHETINEWEIPDEAAHDEAWRAYCNYVIEVRTDPLSQFIVQGSELTVKDTWYFCINDSGRRPVITSLYVRGKYVGIHDVSQYVRDFLCLGTSGHAMVGITWDELKANGHDIGWNTAEIEEKFNAPRGWYEQELVRLATECKESHNA